MDSVVPPLRALRRALPWLPLPARSVWVALAPGLLLAAITAALCWRLLSGQFVVIGYDTLTYFYPYRAYAGEVIRGGQLPHWNPYLFYGVPFLANIQTAVFYPLNALFYVLAPTTALNWSVILHLFLASFFAYLWLRHSLAVVRPAALVGGALFGFGGFVGAQVGHLNQLNAAVWLPLALLTFHRAVSHGSGRWTVATGVILATQILAGHSQESYMTVVTLAAYGAWLGLSGRGRPLQRVVHALGRWPVNLVRRLAATAGVPQRLVPGKPGSRWGSATTALLALVGSATLAAALASVQLFPTSELTGLSTRGGGLTLGEAASFSLPPTALLVGLLPTFGLTGPTSTEYIGYVGVVGLLLAGVGLLLRFGEGATRFWGAVALAALILALGKYTPVYGMLYPYLPGLDLFRVPARWLMVWSLALAALASLGLDRLWGATPDGRGAALARLAALAAVGAAVVLALLLLQQLGSDAIPLTLVWRWALLAGVALALAAAATSNGIGGTGWYGRRGATILLGAVAVGELFVASRSLEYSRPNPAEVYAGDRPALQQLRTRPRPQWCAQSARPPACWEEAPAHQRLLSIASTAFEPYDTHVLLDPYRDRLPASELQALIINTKYQDILTPNLPLVHGIATIDGYDGGVLPLRRYVEFKSLVLPGEPPAPDSLLRDQVHAIPSQRLLQILGVTVVITDRLADLNVNTVPFNTGQVVELSSRQPRYQFSPMQQRQITQVSFVTTMSAGQDLPAGQPVLRFRVYDTDGSVAAATGVAGEQLADAQVLAGKSGAHGRAPLVRRLPGAAALPAAIAIMDLHFPGDLHPVNRPISVSRVEVELLADAPVVRLHGLTLIGPSPTGVNRPLFQPVALSDTDYLALTMLPNQNVYAHRTALPRAYLVHTAWLAPDGDPALQLLQDAAFTPGREVVLSTAPSRPARQPQAPRRTGLKTALNAASEALRQLVRGLMGHSPAGEDRAGFVSAERLMAWGAAPHSPAPSPQVEQGNPPDSGAVAVSRWEVAGQGGAAAASGAAALVAAEPERIIVETDAVRPGILVLTDTFYPGWRVTVDGAPASLLRANYLFRGVYVPAGAHRVEFTYHPAPFQRGLLVSSLALAVVLVTLLWPLVWRAWRRNRAAPRNAKLS